jgi:hypothetical protein
MAPPQRARAFWSKTSALKVNYQLFAGRISRYFKYFVLIHGFPLLALPICVVTPADRAHLPSLQDWKCDALPRAAASPAYPLLTLP